MAKVNLQTVCLCRINLNITDSKNKNKSNAESSLGVTDWLFHSVAPTGCGEKYPLNFLHLHYIINHLEFRSKVLLTYSVILSAHKYVQYYQHLISLLYFKVISITVCHLHVVLLVCSKTLYNFKTTPANHMQNWLWDSCLDFTANEMWPMNSPELNPGEMLEVNHRHCPKPKISLNSMKCCK